MSHAHALRLQITLVVGVGGNDDGHVFHNLQTVALQADALDGIVGDEAYLGEPQRAQNLGAHAVVALVGLEAQVEVRVDGVYLLPNKPAEEAPKKAYRR